MTREELKRDLLGYRALKREHDQLVEELRRVESTLTSPRSPQYDGMPHSPGGGGDALLGMVSKHIELQRLYCSQIDTLSAEQLRLERLIALAPDAEDRVLLRVRYIDGLEWEDICVRLCYSRRSVHYHCNKALDSIVAQISE